MKRPDNISSLDWQLLQQKYNNLESIVKKINSGYPIQYLIGNVDFYGYIIKVNPSVLIPRFETETLVEKTINYIKKLNLVKASVLDIGTGSGAISIALKSELPKLEITALDNSKKAIAVAKSNAKMNKVDINIIYKNVFKYNLINDFDVIVSNPPYIVEGAEVDAKIKYEPREAIFVSKEDPLIYYRKIFEIGVKVLNKKRLIALEIDEAYGKEMKKLAKTYFAKDRIVLEKDLAGKDRYLFVFCE